MLKLFEDLDEARRTILARDLSDPPLPASVKASLRRIFGQELAPEAAVARILADVRARGDTALRHWTARIDGLELDGLAVPQDELLAAAGRIPEKQLEALRLAAGRIRAFHARQPLPSWTTGELGGLLGQRMTPLDRVGVYVPGGRAPLPSSLLMAAIPAQVAGVRDIVVATPPGRPDGRVADVVLAAAHVAAVAAVYRLGGAQAIAALAFGTESIRRVDKIAGAGNLFVTLAKRQVFGYVGLDGLFGPTETAVVADDSANPAWVAADLLAQAEHDLLATALLFTPSRALAEAVQAEVARQLEGRGRAEIIAAALSGQGGIVLTRDLAEAVALADEFAPEHLCLSVAQPGRWQTAVHHAGGLFLGERSFEVLGDYVAGPSHLMPTGGTARFASPLSALDFVRISSVIALDEAAAERLSGTAAVLAEAEGLDGHAHAARLRAGAGQSGAASLEPAPAVARIRDNVRAMIPYQPILPFEVLARQSGRAPEAIVKLDANENPYGPSPRARQALADGRYFHIYPDPESRSLRAALASFTGVPAERLLVGTGADELIDLALRAVLEPGDVVVNCPPSFGMYPFSTAVNGGRLLEAPRRPDFAVDVAAVETVVLTEPRARVLFLCSPNNPDGSMIGDEIVRRLLALPLLVVLDEAYVEFSGRPSRITWALEHDNLVVLRTFSKWAGLAGLRVGYGAFPEWLISQLWKIKQPYNVNVAATLAAEASLADLDTLWANVERLKQEGGRLIEALRLIPYLEPLPSEANFVLCRVRGRRAAELKAALASQSVFVRYFDTPRLAGYIRVTVGRPEDSDALLAALGRIE